MKKNLAYGSSVLMPLILLTLLFLNPIIGLGQDLEIDKTEHDFKTLERNSIRMVDFLITNKSAKNIFILRADGDPQLEFRYSKKTIAPDSMIIFRVHYNPSDKGDFRKKISLYVSSSMDPITFKLKGETNYVPKGLYMPCPNFGDENPLQQMFFELYAKVSDSITKEPIQGSQINFLSNGKEVSKVFTDKKGEAIPQVEIGKYYIVVSARGYKSKEFPKYLNRLHDEVIVELIPIKKVEPIVEVVEEEIEIPEEIKTEPVVVPVEEVVVETKTNPNPGGPVEGELPTSLYKPNNIVFLIDISKSMGNIGRLDILKSSIITLLDELRSVDKVTVVVYASKADIILTTRPASQKEYIKQVIMGLQSGGFTKGGKGMRLAYRVAKKSFIEGGNNQVIIATDGAFDTEDGDLAALIKRNAKDGVKMSVVGVKNKEWTEKSMKAYAKNGQGNYIHIDNFEASRQALLNEIKMSSRIGGEESENDSPIPNQIKKLFKSSN